jgi:hypothetical protein
VSTVALRAQACRRAAADPMWRYVVTIWACSRVVTILYGWELTSFLGWHRAIEPWQTQPWRAVTGWDTAYYIEVARHGYGHNLTVAFFPLYAIGIRAWETVTGMGDATAALAVANLSVLVAFAGLYVLGRRRLGEEHARRAVLYLALSPYAFALVMGYSEGLFLALTVWMVVLFDSDREVLAAPLGLLAGLTRVTALAIVPSLAIVALRRRRVATWVAAAAPVVAFGLFALWLDHAVGDPLAMVHVQKHWGGRPTFPLFSLVDQFTAFVRTLDFFFLARGLTVIGYLALLIPILRLPRFAPNRWEDTMYVLGIFAMPLFSNVLLSVGRFGLVAFPLMFALADLGLRRRNVHRAYVVFAPTFQIIFFTAAALGYRAP